MGHSIFFRIPPIEVLYISPPQQSKLFTPQRKEDQSANTLPLQDLFKNQWCQHTKDPPPLPPRVKILDGMAQFKFNASQDGIQNIPLFRSVHLSRKKHHFIVLMAPQQDWKNEERKWTELQISFQFQCVWSRWQQLTAVYDESCIRFGAKLCSKQFFMFYYY